MRLLTQQGQQAINNIASRYNLSSSATEQMLQAVVNGSGTMAQFNISELGGQGQWMQGGMTMVGDMFNLNLQGTVNNLCSELSNLIASQNIFQDPPPQTAGNYSGSGNWWPSELGMPNSSGSQNNVRYAYFGQANRLALDHMGVISVYDTQGHQISGVSQQQGGGNSVVFTSQYGIVDTLNLPLVSGPGAGVQATQVPPTPPVQETEQAAFAQRNTDDILKSIEQMAQLHAKGILSDTEFESKKAELLSRL